MNKIFIIHILIFQISCTKDDFRHNQQLQYYDYIYRAEKFLADEQLEDAYNNYLKAFDTKSKVFGKDLFNALVTGCQVNEYNDDLIFSLLKLGLSEEYLCRNNQINSYFLTRRKDSKFQANIEEAIQYSKITLDTILRNKLDSMVNVDQKFRIMDIEEDGIPYNHYRSEIFDIDTLLIAELFRIIETEGFPSEEKLGFKDTFNIPYGYPFEIILWHQSTTNKTKDCNTLLKTAAKNGDLHPETVAKTLDNHNTEKLYGLSPSPCYRVIFEEEFNNNNILSDEDRYHIMIKHPIYCDELSSVEKEKYNNNRHNIGLADVDDFNHSLKVRTAISGLKYIWNDVDVFLVSDSLTYFNAIESTTKMEL